MSKICKGITQRGKQCIRKLRVGRYCSQHKPQSLTSLEKEKKSQEKQIPQILVHRVPRSWIISTDQAPFRPFRGNVRLEKGLDKEIFIYVFLQTRYLPRDIIRIIMNMVRCDTCFVCQCTSSISPNCCYCSDKNRKSLCLTYIDGKGKGTKDRFEHYCPACRNYLLHAHKRFLM